MWQSSACCVDAQYGRSPTARFGIARETAEDTLAKGAERNVRTGSSRFGTCQLDGSQMGPKCPLMVVFWSRFSSGHDQRTPSSTSVYLFKLQRSPVDQTGASSPPHLYTLGVTISVHPPLAWTRRSIPPPAGSPTACSGRSMQPTARRTSSSSQRSARPMRLSGTEKGSILGILKKWLS